MHTFPVFFTSQRLRQNCTTISRKEHFLTKKEHNRRNTVNQLMININKAKLENTEKKFDIVQVVFNLKIRNLVFRPL